MLSETAIIEINKQLDLCDTYKLNQYEIDLLNHNPAIDPQETCQYWGVSKTVLDNRAKTDPSMATPLEMLQILSNMDGCEIKVDEPAPVDVKIPYFGGALD